MGTFSFTHKKRLSMGNVIAHVYTLTNVQTTGSKLYLPFKKAFPPIIETTTPNTSCITVVTNSEANGPGTCATFTFAADAESSGTITVAGLL